MRRRSLMLVGPRQLEWLTEEVPPLTGDEVLIETAVAAISIGTELPLYHGTSRHSGPARYPRMTGYESAGSVIACGPEVRRLNVGDRAVAFYGHRTHGIVPEAKAIAVPDGIPDALALLTILSCDVAKGVRKVRPDYAERVLVTGAGAIGLLTLFMLRALGICAVDIVEPLPQRRALALRMGARRALAPAELDTGTGEQYSVGFECSAGNAAFTLLQERLRPGGRICVLSDGNREPLVLVPAFHEKELTIVGSNDGWDYQQHAAWFFDTVRDNPAHLHELFGHQTTASGLIETFDRLAREAIRPVKVLVRYR